MKKRVSPWQALFRYYPGSMADEEHAVVRAVAIHGTKERSPQKQRVCEYIARHIATGENRRKKLLGQRSRAIPQVASGEIGSAPGELDEDPLTSLAAELNSTVFTGQAYTDPDDPENEYPVDLQDGEPVPVPTVLNDRSDLDEVPPDQINLIGVDEARVELEVYPLTFRCPECGHVEMVNPHSDKIPRCPCHSRQAEQIKMRQLSIVEICSRCAMVRPVFPYGLQPRPGEWVGKSIICCQCNEGHLHLRRGHSLNDTHWVCTNGCHLDAFKTMLGGPCPTCNTGLPKSQWAYLKPVPAMAPSNLAPLVDSFLSYKGLTADLDTLRQAHMEQRTATGMWHVDKLADQAFPEKAVAIGSQYGMVDAFLLTDVTTTTVNYGYWSRAEEHIHPIPDVQRLPVFYRNGRQYSAYFIDTLGHGLTIALNKPRLLKVVNSTLATPFASYDEMAAAAIDLLRAGGDNTSVPFQKLMDSPEDYPALRLVCLLHSLEHAILTQSNEQVGLQVFGSKILLTDAALVLFEQEDVGDGGLVQLTLGNGFLKLLRGARQRLSICGQGCDHGCPACNYLDDAQCRPFAAHEFGKYGVRWLPPNGLLRRELASQFLAAPEVIHA